MRGAVAAGLVALALGACRHPVGDTPGRPPSPIAAPDPALVPIVLPPWKDVEEPGRRRILESEVRLAGLVAQHRSTKPDLAAAYGELGKAYHSFGLHHFAIPCYENAGRLEPEAFRWRYYRARAHWHLREAKQAQAALDEALRLEPRNLPAVLLQARMHRAAERLEPARAGYELALQISPDCTTAHYELGDLEFQAGEVERAIGHFEAALASQPRATRTHYQLAQAYRRLGNAEKAEFHMARRGETDIFPPPDPLMEEVAQLNPRIFARRGVSALRNGRYEEAVAQLSVAVQDSPQDPDYRMKLGMALAAAGRPLEALPHYQEALRLQPADAQVHYQLGVTLSALGRDREAEAAIRRSVELHAESAETQLALAQALRRLGKDAEALAPLDAAVRLDPSNLPARLARGRLQARLGKCKDAVSDVEKSLKTFPESRPLASLLAGLLASCPDPGVLDPKRALGLAQPLFAAEPTVEHASNVALAQAAHGDWKQAEAWQRRALALLPPDRAPRVRVALTRRLEAYREKRLLPVEW